MTTDAVLKLLTEAAECERRLKLPECRDRLRPIYEQTRATDLGRVAPAVCAAIPELGYIEGVGFCDLMSGEVIATARVMERYQRLTGNGCIEARSAAANQSALNCV